jgi:hypothetical protein
VIATRWWRGPGVEYHSQSYQDDDAGLVDYVKFLSFHRRHLIKDQKTAVASPNGAG